MEGDDRVSKAVLRVDWGLVWLIGGGIFLLGTSIIGLVQSWDLLNQFLPLTDLGTRLFFGAVIMGFYFFVVGTMATAVLMKDALTVLTTPSEREEGR